MPVKLLLALVLALLMVPVAQAASFDCTKAASPFEKAICSDPDLSAQDDTLAVAYKTAVGGLSKEGSDVMLKGQRDWLAFVGKVCADDMLPGVDSLESERVACLSSQYITRIRSLKGSRMLGGLRFFLSDTFWSAPDPDGETYYKIATATTSSPRLDGNGKDAKPFNAMIESEVAKAVKAFAAEGGGEDVSTSSDSDLSLTVSNVNDARIDVEVSTYWFGHGAAHGNYTINYLHFLREQGRNMTADDLFAGKDWNQHLADLALKRLKDDRDELLWDIEADWLKEAVADPARWKFSNDGLIIQFQPYEVASYADGAVTAEIPWSQLQDDLSETGSTLIYN